MAHPNSLANLLPPYGVRAQPEKTGRNAGTRDKITRRMLELLHDDFEKFGEEAIPMWREQHLDRYMSAIMALLPKEATLNINTKTVLDDLTVEQLAQLADGLTQLAGVLAPGAGDAEEEASPGEPAGVH